MPRSKHPQPKPVLVSFSKLLPFLTALVQLLTELLRHHH